MKRLLVIILLILSISSLFAFDIYTTNQGIRYYMFNSANQVHDELSNAIKLETEQLVPSQAMNIPNILTAPNRQFAGTLSKDDYMYINYVAKGIRYAICIQYLQEKNLLGLSVIYFDNVDMYASMTILNLSKTYTIIK